jgi:hypothetical protein
MPKSPAQSPPSYSTNLDSTVMQMDGFSQLRSRKINFPLSHSESEIQIRQTENSDSKFCHVIYRIQLRILGTLPARVDRRWIYGGFQDRGGNTFDILGDVFLKNVYAVCTLGWIDVDLGCQE